MSSPACFIPFSDLRFFFRKHAQHGDVRFHLALGAWPEGAWQALALDVFPPEASLPVTLVCDLLNPATSRAEVVRLLERGARVLHLPGQIGGVWAHSMAEDPPLPGDPWGSCTFALCGTLAVPASAAQGLETLVMFDDAAMHRDIITRIESAASRSARSVTRELLDGLSPLPRA